LKLIVAITGASGVVYGVRLLEELKKIDSMETHLIISDKGTDNIGIETGYSIEFIRSLADHHHDWQCMTSPLASGSFLIDAMVINPCSMKTLAAIACGYCENLITRAADITIKEKRKLILCPRESPLSAIHLENMLKLSRLGVLILPPMPGFYTRPATIDDIIDHHIMKIFDQIKLPFMGKRWN
jgi:4-hydroxy-3-polyprenylbenzoate decarboxylase